MHELDNEEYQEKAALYALGALSQHEARAFERHLAEGCSSCEAELRTFEEVAGTVSLDAPSAAPPPYLRDVLMARIAREVQAAPTSAPQPLPSAPRPISMRTSRPEPSFSRSSFGSVILPWAIAASLAIAALAAMFTLIRSERDLKNLQAEVTRERSKAEELAQINEVLTSPEHREIALAGQAPAPSASGKVYWDVRKNRWVVSAELPQPPKGKVYQLWFVTKKNETISAGLISPDQSGHGFQVTNVPPNIGPLAAAAITLEPEGGSPKPTMPIYVVGAAG